MSSSLDMEAKKASAKNCALGLAIPCKVMIEICKNMIVVERNCHCVDTSSNSRQPMFMMKGTALRPIMRHAPCAWPSIPVSK